MTEPQGHGRIVQRIPYTWGFLPVQEPETVPSKHGSVWGPGWRVPGTRLPARRRELGARVLRGLARLHGVYLDTVISDRDGVYIGPLGIALMANGRALPRLFQAAVEADVDMACRLLMPCLTQAHPQCGEPMWKMMLLGQLDWDRSSPGCMGFDTEHWVKGFAELLGRDDMVRAHEEIAQWVAQRYCDPYYRTFDGRPEEACNVGAAVVIRRLLGGRILLEGNQSLEGHIEHVRSLDSGRIWEAVAG